MKHLLKLKPWQQAAFVGVLLFIASNVAYTLVLGGAPTMVKGADGYPVHSDSYNTAETVKKALGGLSAVAFAYAAFLFVRTTAVWDRIVERFKAARQQTRQVDSDERQQQPQPMGTQTPSYQDEIVDYPENVEPLRNETADWNDW